METLRAQLSRAGGLRKPDAVGWCVRLAKRIEQLHALGVAHGNISPDCVLVAGSSPDSRGVLVDVRRAKANPAYHSPERAAGAGGLSPADDAWALAMTLYAALSGENPFEAAPAEQARSRAASGPPPGLPPAKVDPALRAVLDRALSADAASRFSRVRELREALEATLPAPRLPLPPLDEEEDTHDSTFDASGDVEEDERAQTRIVRPVIPPHLLKQDAAAPPGSPPPPDPPRPERAPTPPAAAPLPRPTPPATPAAISHFDEEDDDDDNANTMIARRSPLSFVQRAGIVPAAGAQPGLGSAPNAGRGTERLDAQPAAPEHSSPAFPPPAAHAPPPLRDDRGAAPSHASLPASPPAAGQGAQGLYPGYGAQGVHPGYGPQGVHPGHGPQGVHPGHAPQGVHPGHGPQGVHPGHGPAFGPAQGYGGPDPRTTSAQPATFGQFGPPGAPQAGSSGSFPAVRRGRFPRAALVAGAVLVLLIGLAAVTALLFAFRGGS